MQKFNKKIIIYMICIIFSIGIIMLFLYNNTNIFSQDLVTNNTEYVSNLQTEEMNNEGIEEQTLEEMEKNEILIHIIGEVNNQGIVKLKEGARIIDAIQKAGGTTDLADVSKVNLAFVLSDGQKVNIPNINENIDNFVYVTDASGENAIVEENINNNRKNEEKVNINTASQTELETLSGIGPSTAAKIIHYREKNGKFKKIEDIKNINGIGDSKFNEIKDNIVVK